MKFSKLTICFFIILTAFSACREDDLVIDEKGKDNVVTIKYQVESSGIVTDKIGDPIQNATVSLGDQFTQTDQNGYFQITGLANADKGVLKVEKSGYFTGYPVFYPVEGLRQHIRFELQDRVMIGSVDNNSKTVTLNQHQINFSNATFKDASGAAYNGEVTVYAAYLDPTDEHLNNYMSGDLVGINTQDEEQVLTSYGMLNVELEDDSGNVLNIDGEAELTMEVPSSILGQAPSSIPLWYFDEETGNWIEEGEATLVGNQYVGNVTHFTLWNCDVPYPLVTITGSLNVGFTPLDPQGFQVLVTNSNGESRVTNLNNSFGFQGKVPANEILTLEVIDQCGEALITESIGPFSTSTNLGSFDIILSTVPWLTINGTIVDCDLNPVSNGYVIISDNNNFSQIIDVNSDGSYQSTHLWCTTNTVSVIAYDSDNQKISESTNFDYSETLSTGALITCETLLAGIHISGPEVNKFIPITDNLTPPSNPSGSSFTFVNIDDQGNGNKVIYSHTVLDWGAPTGQPFLNAAMDAPSVLGNPTDVISWGGLDNPDLPTQIYNPVSGGVIDVRFKDIEVEVLDANLQTIATHSGHTIRYTLLFD